MTLAPLAKVSPGLSAIRASDCFNCHHASQKLIGPSFNDIAKRYKGDAAAFDSSVERVIKGSSKVWGEIPMLPHPNLKRNQVASMVRWIYSLSEKNTPQVSRGVKGNMMPSSDESITRAIRKLSPTSEHMKAKPLRFQVAPQFDSTRAPLKLKISPLTKAPKSSMVKASNSLEQLITLTGSNTPDSGLKNVKTSPSATPRGARAQKSQSALTVKRLLLLKSNPLATGTNGRK